MSRPPDRESRDPAGPRPRAELTRFEDTVLPHLDSAYNLARYLLRDPHDAEDAVQDACLRALRYFAGFQGGNSRAWLLTIVRRTCYTRRRRDWARALTTEFDEEQHAAAERPADPEPSHARATAGRTLHGALERLPVKFREVLVLRELEGLSY